jgi:hypothetical protein
MQITVIAFQYQTIHLASYQSYQSHLIQYHPNQSTIDEAGPGETLTKKQKVKHAASMHTFHGASFGRYIIYTGKNQSGVKNRT